MLSIKFFGLKNSVLEKLKLQKGLNCRVPFSFTKYKIIQHFNLLMEDVKHEKRLREQIKNRIQFFQEINNYRGHRHKQNLPVRGQRTHTNAATRKNQSTIKKSSQSFKKRRKF